MTAEAMLTLVFIFLAGLALGAFYFISLWQTVRRLPRTENRARLLVISFILRLGVVLTALFVLMDGRWERIAAAMLGFVLMRKILTYRLGPRHWAEAVESHEAGRL